MTEALPTPQCEAPSGVARAPLSTGSEWTFELLERYAEPAGVWSYVLSPALIMATSMAFEVFEWWAAVMLGGGVGSDYLGAQGDEWDAQKDMALATAGAIITMIVTVIVT